MFKDTKKKLYNKMIWSPKKEKKNWKIVINDKMDKQKF